MALCVRPATASADLGYARAAMATYPSFPFRLRFSGRVATVDLPTHVGEMIEEVLFTRPGERVNHPDFGCGLEDLVFEPNGDAATAAAALTVSAELQHWLGDIINVSDVDVTADDGTMTIAVTYTLVGATTAQPQTVRVVR